MNSSGRRHHNQLTWIHYTVNTTYRLFSHFILLFCGISNEAGNAVTFFLLLLPLFDNTYELLLYTADEIKTKNNNELKDNNIRNTAFRLVLLPISEQSSFIIYLRNTKKSGMSLI